MLFLWGSMHQGGEEQVYPEARRILRSLFLGIDPEIHSRLSPECVVMQPDVKVALALGAEALQRVQWMQQSKAKSIPKHATVNRTGSNSKSSMKHAVGLRKGPSRAGEGWTSSEDDEVSQAFHQGESLSVIARSQQRTRGAIAARLVRLGLVSNRQEARKAS